MSEEALSERYSASLMATYKQFPVEFVRGEGSYLWDAEGREYLDFLTGISVCSLGHCHPAVVEAVRDQVGTLIHVSNLFQGRHTAELAERLSDSSLGGRVFFTNSGAEANECAIKLVRKAARERGVADPEIVVFEGGFHGRTMGAVSASPGMRSNDSFAPYVPGFKVVPRDDPEAVDAAVDESTAAVLCEPIQGEAGVYPLSDEVLAAARAATERVGAALVLDEVQAGMGRTGSLWAFEQTPVRPDVLTTAKALGGGLPIGACIGADAWGQVLRPGDHGSTFAGGPVVARAALAALSVVADRELLSSVRERGDQLQEGLAAIEGVVATRGRGLMVGADLGEGLDAPAAVTRMLGQGLVANATGPSTLRFLPPLTVDRGQVATALERVEAALASADES